GEADGGVEPAAEVGDVGAGGEDPFAHERRGWAYRGRVTSRRRRRCPVSAGRLIGTRRDAESPRERGHPVSRALSSACTSASIRPPTVPARVRVVAARANVP